MELSFSLPLQLEIEELGVIAARVGADRDARAIMTAHRHFADQVSDEKLVALERPLLLCPARRGDEQDEGEDERRACRPMSHGSPSAGVGAAGTKTGP